jgi:hypothetical protein
MLRTLMLMVIIGDITELIKVWYENILYDMGYNVNNHTRFY